MVVTTVIYPTSKSYTYVIALVDSEKVKSMHIAETIGYRNLDQGDWAERGI